MRKQMLPGILLWSIIAVTLIGCLGPHFTVLDSGYKFKSDKIAIVAGGSHHLDAILAARLSQELAKKSTFKVMHTKEIASRIEGYPLKIRGPYSSAHIGINEDYSNTDMRRVRMIQKKLGVDYLYVMWAPSVVEWTQGALKTVDIYIITQMFEFPSGKEVAHGNYFIEYVKQGMSVGVPRTIEGAIEYTTQKAVEAILKKTGRGKARIK